MSAPVHAQRIRDMRSIGNDGLDAPQSSTTQPIVGTSPNNRPGRRLQPQPLLAVFQSLRTGRPAAEVSHLIDGGSYGSAACE